MGEEGERGSDDVLLINMPHSFTQMCTHHDPPETYPACYYPCLACIDLLHPFHFTLILTSNIVCRVSVDAINDYDYIVAVLDIPLHGVQSLTTYSMYTTDGINYCRDLMPVDDYSERFQPGIFHNAFYRLKNAISLTYTHKFSNDKLHVI